MSRSWYQLLAQKNPNYKKYQRINKSWFVVDFSFEFKVLPLHKDLFEFLIKKNFHYDLEKTQIQNANVGYVHLQNNALDESSWVPLLLLLGYSVWKDIFLNFLLKEGNSLQFY